MLRSKYYWELSLTVLSFSSHCLRKCSSLAQPQPTSLKALKRAVNQSAFDIWHQSVMFLESGTTFSLEILSSVAKMDSCHLTQVERISYQGHCFPKNALGWSLCATWLDGEDFETSDSVSFCLTKKKKKAMRSPECWIMCFLHVQFYPHLSGGLISTVSLLRSNSVSDTCCVKGWPIWKIKLWQTIITIMGVYAALKMKYLKHLEGFRHRGSCLAIHVTLIALEHFQISLKNNILWTKPWGIWGFCNRGGCRDKLSVVCYLVTQPSRPFPHNQILTLHLVWPCAPKLCYRLMTDHLEKDNLLQIRLHWSSIKPQLV